MDEEKMSINEERIELKFKTKKRPINAAKISITIGVVIILIVMLFSNKKNRNVKEPIDYNSAIENQSEKKEAYVRIRIIDIVQIDHQYCLIKDEKDNTLVALLNEETINKILEEYKTKGKEFFYDIEGYIRYNLSDWQKNKIQIYLVKNNLLSSEDNYEKVIARGYLNEQVSSMDVVVLNFIMLAVLFIISGLYFAFIYWTDYVVVKKYNKAFNYDEIIRELRKNTTKVFEPQNIYLAKEYIVSVDDYLDIIKYQDIFWIYTVKKMEESKLVAVTTNGKVVSIASAYKEEKLDKIIESIKEKNEKILLGYTNENRKKYKEYKNNLK